MTEPCRDPAPRDAPRATDASTPVRSYVMSIPDAARAPPPPASSTDGPTPAGLVEPTVDLDDRDADGARRALRARRAAVHRPAVRGGAADDPQPGRRRGRRAGDLREGVLVLPPVHAGHQPQGVAVPDPDEHLHQHLPQEAAAAARSPTARTSRTGSSARAESHTSSGLQVGGDEALEHLPDSDVKDALQQLPRTSGWRCSSPTSRASPTRRSPRSWAPRSGP